uniref:Rx N-terminal domain-containing protein n=1 Tax=Oryza punctata TaxID=4537 RepID=A0A0E0KM56_ORYPU
MAEVGWITSPVATRLLREGLEFLGFNDSERLRDLDTRMAQAERIPPCLEQWATNLRSAFYDTDERRRLPPPPEAVHEHHY